MRYLGKTNLKQWQGKICLLRIDLNIENEREKKSLRIDAILPTIKLLLKHNIKIILLSHRGHPNGRDKSLSLKPFQKIIVEKIGEPVIFLPDLNTARKVKNHSKNKVFLLENMRFWLGEAQNSPNFAKKLAFLGEFYINEAFPVSHRKNASISAITRFLPSYAGLRFQIEIERLREIMKERKHPFIIILGGAKISDKIGVIKYLWNRADYFFLGGGLANTFFAARGLPVGDSLVDKNAKFLISNYLNSKKIILPSDIKISSRKILDVGERTIEEYSEIIKKSKTIIWNGPMGLFEKRGFENGTKGIWKAVLRNKKAKVIVGGGETVASLKLLISNYKLPKNVFLSTGGGAMLEFLSGKKLPGITALEKNNRRL